MDASFPPFEVVDGDGRFVGFDVDLATALAERWGVGVRFVDVHFDGLYDALQADKFDLIISALPYDRTMTRDVAYSVSYYDAGELLRNCGRIPLRRRSRWRVRGVELFHGAPTRAPGGAIDSHRGGGRARGGRAPSSYRLGRSMASSVTA